MRVAPPKTPQEIRDLMLSDVSLAEDRHLLAVLLGIGTAGRRRGRVRKSRSSLGLAEALFEEASGWMQLVDGIHAETVVLSDFGIGVSVGARLVASVELSRRWRRGFRDEGGEELRAGELQRRVFQRQGRSSEAELMAVAAGASAPARDPVSDLLVAFGNPREIMTSLTLELFESFRKDTVFHLRLAGTDVEVEFATICRLVAAVELARRYRRMKGAQLPPLKAGMFGLKSPLLVELLDPSSSVDPELRDATIGVLRSHPEMASDITRLDRVAHDAGTSDGRRAIELSLMFELLRKDSGWTHPAEVLGEAVPYGPLLAIAEARIERSARPATRMLKIKERLEHASLALPEEPIESFADALARLGISRSAADRAIEEARRRYLEKASRRELAGSA